MFLNAFSRLARATGFIPCAHTVVTLAVRVVETRFIIGGLVGSGPADLTGACLRFAVAWSAARFTIGIVVLWFLVSLLVFAFAASSRLQFAALFNTLGFPRAALGVQGARASIWDGGSALTTGCTVPTHAQPTDAVRATLTRSSIENIVL